MRCGCFWFRPIDKKRSVKSPGDPYTENKGPGGLGLSAKQSQCLSTAGAGNKGDDISPWQGVHSPVVETDMVVIL